MARIRVGIEHKVQGLLVWVRFKCCLHFLPASIQFPGLQTWPTLARTPKIHKPRHSGLQVGVISSLESTTVVTPPPPPPSPPENGQPRSAVGIPTGAALTCATDLVHPGGGFLFMLLPFASAPPSGLPG